jgi:hypothetical protein
MENLHGDDVVVKLLSRVYQPCDFTSIPIGSAIEIGKDMGLTREASRDRAKHVVAKGRFTHHSMTGR